MIDISIDNARETRIFMPFIDPFSDDDWSERILGEVICPFVSRFDKQLEWFWFSRYYLHKNMDSGSCDIEKLPEKCFNPDDLHRSLRFRFRINAPNQIQIEQTLEETIKKAKCVITDIRDYPTLNDLASERFAPRDLPHDRKIIRAKLITNLYHAISKTVLDCLVKGEDGKWRIEKCPHNNNYFDTMFESLHHLFCNITSVTTAVAIIEKNGHRTVVGPMQLQSYADWKTEQWIKVEF